jgi:tetratricopeptide (TPR) repeat protein
MLALINLKLDNCYNLQANRSISIDAGPTRAKIFRRNMKMRRSYLLTSIIAAAVLVLSAVVASSQTGQLRGSVKLQSADGTLVPVVGATIDVFRTDITGEYHTKTDKKGEWVFAGLPFIGHYLVAVSAPGAAPDARSGVRAGKEVPVDMVLNAGDGRKLSRTDAVALTKTGGAGSEGPATAGGGGGESAEDKAKREELIRKNAEIEAANKKAENTNEIVGNSFKAGNAARSLKNYDEAIKQYDIGLAADPDQAALLTNKADVLKSRGVDKYNAAIKTEDAAAKTAGIESAKVDFKAAAEAGDKAAEVIKKEPAATDPADQKRREANKYVALAVRAESYRLYVSKGDATKADAGIAAFQDYIGVETDAAKKSKAQLDLAQMLLDSGSGVKAFAEYQKILAAQPDDPDANLGAGLALFSTGDKAKYQEAANFLQRFVDKAPEGHKFKNDAKAILAEMKSTENVVPEKRPPTRRRP